MPVALAVRFEAADASPVANAAGSRLIRLWRATTCSAPHWRFPGSKGFVGMTPRSVAGSPVRTNDPVTSHAVCGRLTAAAGAEGTVCVLCVYSANAPNDL